MPLHTHAQIHTFKGKLVKSWHKPKKTHTKQSLHTQIHTYTESSRQILGTHAHTSTRIPILVAHNQSTVPAALPYILPLCNPVQRSPVELLALNLIIDTTPSNYHCYQQPPPPPPPQPPFRGCREGGSPCSIYL